MITGCIFDDTGLLPRAMRLHVQGNVCQQTTGVQIDCKAFFLLLFPSQRKVQPCVGFAHGWGLVKDEIME